MVYAIENVKITSSFRKESKLYGKIESRKTCAFIFRIKGSCDYLIEGKHITLNEGEVIFLPSGTDYEYRVADENENLYTSINFTADFQTADPTVYSFKDFHRADYISQSFSELWKFGNQADKYECLSIFYDFLSYLGRIDTTDSSNKDKYKFIEPAMEYLKKHIFHYDFKIEKLHSLCKISDTYFRKIFKSRFNMSPKEYVISERLSHAKSILESGEFDTVSEVAEAVGFSDPLYFSKAFKSFYGFSPSVI